MDFINIDKTYKKIIKFFLLKIWKIADTRIWHPTDDKLKSGANLILYPSFIHHSKSVIQIFYLCLQFLSEPLLKMEFILKMVYSLISSSHITLKNHSIRKSTICICENNKGADQLRGNRENDLRLCFRYTDSTIPLLLNFKLLACF